MELDAGRVGRLRRADQHPASVEVDGGDVAPPAVSAVAHAPALAHRDQLQVIDRAEVVAGAMVDQPPGVERQPVAQEPAAALVRADEADILAVRLGRGAEAQSGRFAPHLLLGEVADRKGAAGQLVLAQHGEHVRLVLQRVGPPTELEPAGCGRPAGVVTGGHGVEPEGHGPVEEPIEFEVAVALDAGVGGAAFGVARYIRRHHPRLEVVGEVEDVMDQSQLIGDPAGIVDVGNRAAPRVRAPAPELQGGAHHVGAPEVAGQYGRGDRGVDPSRHGNEHSHPFSFAVA